MKKYLLDISDLIGANYGKSQEYLLKFSLISPDPENILLKGPLKGKAKVTNLEDSYLLEINCSISFELVCSRCAEKYLNKQKLVIKKEVKEKSLIEHKSINLTPIINEEIIVSLPIKPLCSRVCRGRCPNCGINKNKEQCRCKIEKVSDNPFAKLKLLIDKENNGRAKKEINKTKPKNKNTKK